MTGATVLKMVLLDLAGLRVVLVEYQEWDNIMLLRAPTRIDWLLVHIGLAGINDLYVQESLRFPASKN